MRRSLDEVALIIDVALSEEPPLIISSLIKDKDSFGKSS
jgi:hypothetical protein